MSSFRFHVALAAAKLSKGLIQLLGRNGTHTPGVIALKICPDFLAQAPKAPLTICVTGTNGKTTCSNLITDVLEKLSATEQVPISSLAVRQMSSTALHLRERSEWMPLYLRWTSVLQG